jgi:hypothetical protein
LVAGRDGYVLTMMTTRFARLRRTGVAALAVTTLGLAGAACSDDDGEEDDIDNPVDGVDDQVDDELDDLDSAIDTEVSTPDE